jgi:TrmH family RNA methyltransferase
MADIRFVLVRPAAAANVGAAARALKNMGASELWLVAPRWTDPAAALRLAHGAHDVLHGARTVGTLAAAVADCRWVVGTTRRAGRRRAIEWDPRRWARAVHDSPARRPLAVVFGPEADGLAGAELRLCGDIVRIPAAAAQPSLNLAQAVLVLAYELYMAGLECDAGPAGAAAPPAEAAAGELEALYAHVESALLAVGFLRPDTAQARMLALRKIFARSRLRTGEVRLLRGICRQALWAAASRHARPEAPFDPSRTPPYLRG